MPELIAKSALDVAQLALAGLKLVVHNPGPLTLIAPFPDQDTAVAKALKPLGLTLPKPGEVSAKGDARLVWAGRGQALLVGSPAPEGLSPHAAVTDQTDGWVCLTLTGPRAAQALSRLVALDLRPTAFAPGTSARAALNHMPLILIRDTVDGVDSFQILTFRSMARTAWNELAEVLHHLDARDRLPV